MKDLNLTIEKKLILIGGIIGIISLFLPWVTSFSFEVKGLSGGGWLLLAFVYPVYGILKKKYIKKNIAVILLVIGLAVMLRTLIVTMTIVGNHVEKGMYWMFISLIISLVGVLISKKDNEGNI